MKVTFYNEHASVVKDLHCDFVRSLGGLLIKDPKIIDGLGERTVIGESGKFVKRAEIVEITWSCTSGKSAKSFSGSESYIIQSIVEELESL